MSEGDSESSGFKSTIIGEVKLTEASTVRVSTFDGRDGRKRVDIRLFLSAVHGNVARWESEFEQVAHSV